MSPAPLAEGRMTSPPGIESIPLSIGFVIRFYDDFLFLPPPPLFSTKHDEWPAREKYTDAHPPTTTDDDTWTDARGRPGAAGHQDMRAGVPWV